MWTQSCLYVLPLIGGLGLRARWSSASSAGGSGRSSRASLSRVARLVAGLGLAARRAVIFVALGESLSVPRGRARQGRDCIWMVCQLQPMDGCISLSLS